MDEFEKEYSNMPIGTVYQHPTSKKWFSKGKNGKDYPTKAPTEADKIGDRVQKDFNKSQSSRVNSENELAKIRNQKVTQGEDLSVEEQAKVDNFKENNEAHVSNSDSVKQAKGSDEREIDYSNLEESYKNNKSTFADFQKYWKSRGKTDEEIKKMVETSSWKNGKEASNFLKNSKTITAKTDEKTQKTIQPQDTPLDGKTISDLSDDEKNQLNKKLGNLFNYNIEGMPMFDVNEDGKVNLHIPTKGDYLNARGGKGYNALTKGLNALSAIGAMFGIPPLNYAKIADNVTGNNYDDTYKQIQQYVNTFNDRMAVNTADDIDVTKKGVAKRLDEKEANADEDWKNASLDLASLEGKSNLEKQKYFQNYMNSESFKYKAKEMQLSNELQKNLQGYLNSLPVTQQELFWKSFDKMPKEKLKELGKKSAEWKNGVTDMQKGEKIFGMVTGGINTVSSFAMPKLFQ